MTKNFPNGPGGAERVLLSSFTVGETRGEIGLSIFEGGSIFLIESNMLVFSGRGIEEAGSIFLIESNIILISFDFEEKTGSISRIESKMLPVSTPALAPNKLV